MRLILLSTLLLAACSSEPATSGLASGSYAGEGRDGLCVAGEGETQRAGLIVYGDTDINCSVSGRVQTVETRLALIPAGDSECRIPLSVTANGVKVGEVPAACAYYCGPGGALAGKTFSKDDAASPITDLAGEPLC